MAKNKIEHKTIQFKVDNGNQEEGVFKGLGSGFNDIDQGNDMMKAGCFDECLSMKSPDQIKCLWQHNQTEPLGYYRSIVSTPEGLMVEGKIFATTMGKDALILMKGDDYGKGVDGLSIGFIVEDYEYKTIDGQRVRVITKANLLEISVVTFPMHLRCRINEVKSMNVEDVKNIKSLAEMEDILRDLGATKNAATAIVSRIVELKHISNEGEPQIEDGESNESDSQVDEPQNESVEAHKCDEERAELKSGLNQLIKSLESFKGDK